MDQPLTHVSLCSGIGGFDHGFSRHGIRTVACVEKDANCRAVLRRHHLEAVILDDVCTAGRHNLPARPFVVSFGFPCQDLSVAGKRAGLAGSRSGIFYECLRIVDELRPVYAIWENVPGLLSSDDGRDFARVLLSLGGIGYHGAWSVLDAQWFGVAQRRRRVFGVFSESSAGAQRAAEVLSFERRGAWHPAAGGQARAGVAGDVAACLNSGGNDGGFRTEPGEHLVAWPAQIAPTLNAHFGTKQGLEDQHINGGAGLFVPVSVTGSRTHALSSEGADASEDGTGRGTPIVAFAASDYSNGAFEECEQARSVTTSADRTRATPIVAFGVSNDPTPKFSQELMPPLQSKETGGGRMDVVAFSSKDHGADAGPIAPTLRAMNFADSHLNGGGQVAVAFDTTQLTSPGNYSNPQPGDPCHPLASGAHPPAVAFTERGREGGRSIECQEELAYSLNNPGKGGRTQERQVAGAFGVRRLTPTECLRLQSFPDDWNAWGIDETGKRIEMSDSTRYRQAGNAVCCAVSAWIGRRLILSAGAEGKPENKETKI